MDKGAWWATVQWVAKSQTQLNWLNVAFLESLCGCGMTLVLERSLTTIYSSLLLEAGLQVSHLSWEFTLILKTSEIPWLSNWHPVMKPWGSPGGPGGKEPSCQCRRCDNREFQPWVGKIPWRRAQQPTPILLPRESHGQRSLEGYSP